MIRSCKRADTTTSHRLCGRCSTTMTRHRVAHPILARHLVCPGATLTLYVLAIDLQKMNWKMRAGLTEQTGVSLKERLANNARGEYTHAYQDTAESRNRQRPPQPSSARLSTR